MLLSREDERNRLRTVKSEVVTYLKREQKPGAAATPPSPILLHNPTQGGLSSSTGWTRSLRDRAGLINSKFTADGDLSKLLNVSSAAVFFANGIGDTLLSLPALRALTRIFPNKLTLICPEYNFYVGLSELRAARFVVPPRFSVDEIVARLETCDVFLSLTPWLSVSQLVLLDEIRPIHSVGYFPEFEFRLPLDFEIHAVDLAFKMAKAFDPSLNVDDFSVFPRISETVRKKARVLRSLLPAGCRILAVHLETRPEKMWPLERSVELLELFLNRNPEFVALVFGWNDIFEQKSIPAGVIPCCKVPLQLTFAMLELADLFFGIDSSILHAADLLRLPGLGLFGPTNCARWGFRFGPHIHVSGGNLMEGIEVDAVCKYLEELWARAQSGEKFRYSATPSTQV